MDPGAQASAPPDLLFGRAIWRQDAAGRTLVTLGVDDWRRSDPDVRSRLRGLEDADGEPEPEEEIDGPPVLRRDICPSERISRAR
jgi:hypothetical protein